MCPGCSHPDLWIWRILKRRQAASVDCAGGSQSPSTHPPSTLPTDPQYLQILRDPTTLFRPELPAFTTMFFPYSEDWTGPDCDKEPGPQSHADRGSRSVRRLTWLAGNFPGEVWGPDSRKSRWERKRWSQAGTGDHRPVTPGQVWGIDRSSTPELLLWVTGICGDLTCSHHSTGGGDLYRSEAPAKAKPLPIHLPEGWETG